MKFCTRCLYPENHPLGITFDEKGICSGCRVHDEKYNKADWSERAQQFERLVEPYRQTNEYYDCVIPVFGTGDDFYVVDLVKNKYGLNPLLVTYNTQFNTKVGIRNLARLLTELDCDHVQSTVGPDTVKKVTKETLRLIGDMYWHVLAGSQTFPVQVATKFNIPLIIWGCNGWLDQSGQFSHFDYVEMTKKVRKEHGLRMLDAEELQEKSDIITDQDMFQFTYPTDAQLEKSRVRGIYINNFFFWNSKKQTEYAVEKFGYETMPQERTHNTHESIFCHNNAAIHDYIKYLKFGYSKVTDHLCRDIRLKRITRSEAIKIQKHYQEVKPSNLSAFLEWLNITESQLMDYIEPFRDQRVWQKNNKGEWVKSEDFDCSQTTNPDVELEVIDNNDYSTSKLLETETNEYILTGRQYMDEKNYKAIEE